MMRVVALVLSCLIAAATALPARASEKLSAEINSLLDKHGIVRLGEDQRLADVGGASHNNFTYSSELVQPKGDGFIIVTDQENERCLATLQKLAAARQGRVMQFPDFKTLPADINARKAIFKAIAEANPRYLAIAPRLKSFSENVVLSFWQLLCNLGGGRINVYPSFLVARDAPGLERLIDNSLAAGSDPAGGTAFSAVTIAQAAGPKAGGDRAVQKCAFVEDLLSEMKVPCNALITRTAHASEDRYPKLATLGCFDAGRDGLVHELPPDAARAIGEARLLTMFGHGAPGMTCSLQVGAFKPIPFEGKVVLCGSCFSCYPPFSDLPPAKRMDWESFYGRAIENSARVFYGHMRDNLGFPVMFVAMESLLQGESVGQSYQRVLNVIVSRSKISTRNLILSPDELADDKAVGKRNNFLVIMIGDPTARPFAANNF